MRAYLWNHALETAFLLPSALVRKLGAAAPRQSANTIPRAARKACPSITHHQSRTPRATTMTFNAEVGVAVPPASAGSAVASSIPTAPATASQTHNASPATPLVVSRSSPSSDAAAAASLVIPTQDTSLFKGALSAHLPTNFEDAS